MWALSVRLNSTNVSSSSHSSNVGRVASMTGGELFYHPRFVPARDGAVLQAQLRRLVQRTTGYNCMMRVRTSNGLVSPSVSQELF